MRKALPHTSLFAFFISFFVAVFALIFPKSMKAYDLSSGVALSVPVIGEIADSSVLCSTEQGNTLCTKEYDPNMLGVVTTQAAISLEPTTPQFNAASVVSGGKTNVKVSNESGAIKAGDYLTSSSKPGLAKKALKSGYVLGIALQDLPEDQSEGQIMVSIAIKPAVLSTGAGENLMDLIREGVQGAFLSPLSALRYIVASILVIATIVFAFLHFGKMAKSGVEAIGRNPLASGNIQAGLLINVVLSMFIIAVGVLVAYLVLVI